MGRVLFICLFVCLLLFIETTWIVFCLYACLFAFVHCSLTLTPPFLRCFAFVCLLAYSSFLHNLHSVWPVYYFGWFLCASFPLLPFPSPCNKRTNIPNKQSKWTHVNIQNQRKKERTRKKDRHNIFLLSLHLKWHSWWQRCQAVTKL